MRFLTRQENPAGAALQALPCRRSPEDAFMITKTMNFVKKIFVSYNRMLRNSFFHVMPYRRSPLSREWHSSTSLNFF
jgi:hypothetical protein